MNLVRDKAAIVANSGIACSVEFPKQVGSVNVSENAKPYVMLELFGQHLAAFLMKKDDLSGIMVTGATYHHFDLEKVTPGAKYHAFVNADNRYAAIPSASFSVCIVNESGELVMMADVKGLFA